MGRFLVAYALVVVAGCDGLCRQGAYCSGNIRVDCNDRGDVTGANEQVFTNCEDLLCVDLGNEAKCVLGGGKDPKCPATDIHDMCDGSIYFRCENGYRTAQETCEDPSICVEGVRGCVVGADQRCRGNESTCSGNGYLLLCESGHQVPGVYCEQCSDTLCSMEAPDCTGYTCSGQQLWSCSDGRMYFQENCERIGLRCNSELGECALP